MHLYAVTLTVYGAGVQCHSQCTVTVTESRCSPSSAGLLLIHVTRAPLSAALSSSLSLLRPGPVLSPCTARPATVQESWAGGLPPGAAHSTVSCSPLSTGVRRSRRIRGRSGGSVTGSAEVRSLHGQVSWGGRGSPLPPLPSG